MLYQTRGVPAGGGRAAGARAKTSEAKHQAARIVMGFHTHAQPHALATMWGKSLLVRGDVRHEEESLSIQLGGGAWTSLC